MMLTRAAVRELAQFQSPEGQEWALSFYYQPHTPQSKSHREDSILAKELLRKALQELPKTTHTHNGRKAALNRVLDLVTNLQAGRMRAKAVFASGTDFWREYDLPPFLAGTQLFLDRRFHVKPLGMLLATQPALGVALVDRQRARLFDLRMDELTEREDVFQPLPRPRSDGYAGYDGGHAERRTEERVLQHLKFVSDRLKDQAERGIWQRLILGCHEIHWSEFESLLHPYLKQRVMGHFPCEVAAISKEQVRAEASRIFADWLDRRRQELVKQAVEQAKRGARGATGLRQVLRAIEAGEAQTLVMAENYAARAVQCVSCGRIDSHLVPQCALCGGSTLPVADISEALVALAASRDIELFFVKNNPELDQVGNIAALLRFRAGQGAAGAA